MPSRGGSLWTAEFVGTGVGKGATSSNTADCKDGIVASAGGTATAQTFKWIDCLVLLPGPPAPALPSALGGGSPRTTATAAAGHELGQRHDGGHELDGGLLAYAVSFEGDGSALLLHYTVAMSASRPTVPQSSSRATQRGRCLASTITPARPATPRTSLLMIRRTW